MARPIKKGLDYFSVDCHLDDKVLYLEAKHGLLGYAILVKLWSKIYKSEGYFCEWREKNMYLFCKEVAAELTQVSEVVNTCFEEGIFYKPMHDKYSILTSAGIQKRWQKIVTDAKRKDTEIEAKYSLLHLTPEETALPPEETHKQPSFTPEESTQSRVEESKEEQSKGEESKGEAPPSGDAAPDPKKNRWQGTGPQEPATNILEPPTGKEEKEKGSAQKEKEVSQRQWEKNYGDAWWEFYKALNNGEEPPHSWRNHYTIGGPLKKIQQDLAAVFRGNEESGYQEFVSILDNWPKLRDYHRLQVEPKLIHKNLSEIRMFLREYTGKTIENSGKIPVLGEALEIFREAHLEQRQFYPSISEQYDLPQLGKTLEYLRSLQPDATWEDALQLFTFICNKWPDLERQDEFYAQHFTIRYIHGNTSKIISLLRSGAKKQPDLSLAAAAKWLAANGSGAQR